MLSSDHSRPILIPLMLRRVILSARDKFLRGNIMEYTRLGRTALKVSRLCLGTMNFGPQTTEADSFAIMDKAIDLGINFWDTANVYGWKVGEGVTENILGCWFAQNPDKRDKVIIATKVYGGMSKEKW